MHENRSLSQTWLKYLNFIKVNFNINMYTVFIDLVLYCALAAELGPFHSIKSWLPFANKFRCIKYTNYSSVSQLFHPSLNIMHTPTYTCNQLSWLALNVRRFPHMNAHEGRDAPYHAFLVGQPGGRSYYGDLLTTGFLASHVFRHHMYW